MAQREDLIIELTVAEEFAAQVFWTDEDGDAFPIEAPCRLDCRDVTGALVLQFASENAGAVATKAAITITGSQGLMQLSAPTVVTKLLVPGRYRCDLWATTSNGVAPFVSQERPVVSGWLEVSPRVTIMEAAAV